MARPVNVLVIGDTHAPCMLPGYVNFLQEQQEEHKCTKVVHIGDVADWASISFHEKTTRLKNADEEFEKAFEQVQEIREAFPRLTWLIGNHDCLTLRQGIAAGLPEKVLKSYNKLWEVPHWKVIPRFGHTLIDGVLYQHGDRGKGGLQAALTNAKAEFRSVVQGHHHSLGFCAYAANERKTEEGGRIFGLQTGCGVSHDREAQAYGKKYNAKPLIGCGIVKKGLKGYFEPMEI